MKTNTFINQSQQVTLAVIRMAFLFPKTEDPDFERKHSVLILSTTIGGILSWIFLSVGLWPVYKIFAPFMLIVFWFGMIMSMHFMP